LDKELILIAASNKRSLIARIFREEDNMRAVIFSTHQPADDVSNINPAEAGFIVLLFRPYWERPAFVSVFMSIQYSPL